MIGRVVVSHPFRRASMIPIHLSHVKPIPFGISIDDIGFIFQSKDFYTKENLRYDTKPPRFLGNPYYELSIRYFHTKYIKEHFLLPTRFYQVLPLFMLIFIPKPMRKHFPKFSHFYSHESREK